MVSMFPHEVVPFAFVTNLVSFTFGFVLGEFFALWALVTVPFFDSRHDARVFQFIFQ